VVCLCGLSKQKQSEAVLFNTWDWLQVGFEIGYLWFVFVASSSKGN